MTTLLGYASLACVAAGLVSAAVVLLVSRSGRLALQAALDLWVAAGLLRLTMPPEWEHLLGAAAIIAIRQLAGAALAHRADREAGGTGGVVRPPLGP
ncbi:DUF1622 domain-containing protein [Micromonospora sp. C28SCA-DRY-2]|uniref:DUF1622 domain-containing protein n=1 Tax=Micromonospora sp. C28SCA-DRY-2 TaxID=3059522 RepID=UPI0026754753|nr:DUF1622 domain-containing protein [Micromonospora sp. C28SCA-DRY-2]MDO3700178.1 DUF1622 domain-containing protein [Micromonospora sp. C28SCA-DRY-2]